jgi:hypothetical protein
MARKLAIMVPTKDMNFIARNMQAFVELGIYCNAKGIQGSYFVVEGHCYIENCRNGLVKKALDSGATDLLFIDSDIIFTAVDVVKLLMAAEEKKVVCGIYRVKKDVMTAACKLAEPATDPLHDSKYRKLEVAPTGFFLVRREVYEDPALLEKSEEFITDSFESSEPMRKYYEVAYPVDKKTGYKKFHGEDVMFSKKLLDLGYTIWADMTIDLGHVGQKVYRFTTGNIEDEYPGT